MSFIVNSFFSAKLVFLVGVSTTVPVTLCAKSFNQYTLLRRNYDINKISDENISRFASLTHKDSPTQKTYQGIKTWKSKNLNCSIKFYLPGSKSVWFTLDDKIFTNEKAWPIFEPDKKLGGKNKFERFKEMIDSKVKGIDTYVEFVKSKCSEGLELHWRENSTAKIFSAVVNFENVWVDKQYI